MKKALAESVDNTFYRVVKRPKGAPIQFRQGSIVWARSESNGYGRWRLRLYLFGGKSAFEDSTDYIYTVKDIAILNDPAHFIRHHWPVPVIGQHYAGETIMGGGRVIPLRYEVEGMSGDFVVMRRLTGTGADKIRYNLWELPPWAGSSLKPVALPFATKTRVVSWKTRDFKYRLRVKPKFGIPDRTPDGHEIRVTGVNPMFEMMFDPMMQSFPHRFMRMGGW